MLGLKRCLIAAGTFHRAVTPVVFPWSGNCSVPRFRKIEIITRNNVVSVQLTTINNDVNFNQARGSIDETVQGCGIWGRKKKEKENKGSIVVNRSRSVIPFNINFVYIVTGLLIIEAAVTNSLILRKPGW